MKSSNSPLPSLDQPRSHHPPSDKGRSGLWLILAFLLFLGGGFVVWQLLNSGGPSAEMAQQPPAIPVQLEPVQTGTIEESSEFVGNLRATEGIVLRPEVDGRVTQIYVSSGATVSQGQPLFELSPDRTRAELGAAIANVNAALAARNNAQAQVRAAQAEQIRAATDLELQETEYERARILVTEGAQARQVLDQAIRNRDVAIASLRAAQEQVSAARATFDQASATLNQAQAEVAATQSDLQDTLVVAPIAGVVGDIPTKLGDYVETGDTLTTITQNSNLELLLSVPTERATQLRVGLPVELYLAKDGDPIVTGRISFISPNVNATSQSILAKASFPNPANRLRNNQFVVARMVWSDRPGVLVPTAAIARLGGQPFVFVAEPAPPPEEPVESPPAEQGQPQLVARQKAVTLGTLQGNYYQVLEGVVPGEQIIVSGILNVSDGAFIMPMPSTPAGQASQ